MFYLEGRGWQGGGGYGMGLDLVRAVQAADGLGDGGDPLALRVLVRGYQGVTAPLLLFPGPLHHPLRVPEHTERVLVWIKTKMYCLGYGYTSVVEPPHF